MDHDSISILKPLTPEQRLAALEKAREITVRKMGTQPKREQFQNRSFGRYPGWIVGIIAVLVIIVLVSAFILSAMRLYDIGRSEFYSTIAHDASAMWAGIFVLLMSESSAVLFTVALSVIGDTKLQKGIFIGIALLSTLIALSGNFYVALYERDVTVFSVLEALAPPVITIATSYALKELMLKFVEKRHEEKTSFEEALEKWRKSTADPDKHPDFIHAYADTLKAAIYDANKDGRVKHQWADGTKERVVDILQRFTKSDWLLAVQSEMNADKWFGLEQKPVQAQAQEVARPTGFLPQAQPLPVSEHQ